MGKGDCASGQTQHFPLAYLWTQPVVINVCLGYTP